jgi:hypothetical protein
MKALLAAVLATMLVASAQAETFPIPDNKPVATVTVPDKGWKTSKIARGIELNDDEDEVYLAIEGIDGSNIEETVAGAVAYLNRQGVTIDRSTKKEKEGTLHGFPAYDLGWQGKDKDGDVIVHLMIVSVTPQRGVLFTYWASPEGDKEHDATIGEVIKSLKKVGD